MINYPFQNVVQALIDARKAQGLSQAELGALLGLSQPAVARLESGSDDMRSSTLRRWAAALGLEAEIKFHPLRNTWDSKARGQFIDSDGEIWLYYQIPTETPEWGTVGLGEEFVRQLGKIQEQLVDADLVAHMHTVSWSQPVADPAGVTPANLEAPRAAFLLSLHLRPGVHTKAALDKIARKAGLKPLGDGLWKWLTRDKS